jgi:hypothetical protein
MVAQRERVGAGGEQPVGEPRRQACAVGRVLRVDDAEAGSKLFLQRGKPLLDRGTARRAEDVGDEEDLQGIERVAAGCTSIATWLPASCVTRASAWRSTSAKSRIVPSFEVVAATVEPTVRLGSGCRCVNETTMEGLPLG